VSLTLARAARLITDFGETIGDVDMAKKTAEYTKQQQGNDTIFRVLPAAVPRFTTAIGFGIFVIVISFGMMSGSSGAGVLGLLMGAFCLWYGLTRDLRPKAHRGERTFRVSPQAIEVDGQTYRVADIHRVILRNAITDQELGVEMSNVSSAAAAGMAYRAKVGLVANALTFESGGKATFLAGGMDETTAYGLQHDVCAVIGFK